MNKEKIKRNIAAKYGLGTTLVTGHAARYWEEYAQEYSDTQTAALQNRVKELEGELEKQTMLKQQWYNLYQNALKHNL